MVFTRKPDIERLKNSKNIKELINAFSFKKDSDVRSQAAIAVSELGDFDLIDVLENLLTKKTFRSKFYLSLPSFLRHSFLFDNFQISTEKDKHIKETSEEALGRLYFKFLSDEDQVVRKNALERIKKIPDPFHKTIKTKIKDITFQSLCEEVPYSSNTALTVFQQMKWKGGNTTILKSVLIAIGNKGNSSSYNILFPFLYHSDELIRGEAANSLEKLGWISTDDEITAAFWVAKGEFNKCLDVGQAAVKPLLNVLGIGSGSQKNQMSALKALGTLKAVEAEEVIRGILTRKDSKLAELAKQTLIELGCSLKIAEKKTKVKTPFYHTYFEVPVPTGNGLCSDDECPCDPMGVVISRGTGYLYIPKEAVEFRKDCLKWNEVEKKAREIRRQMEKAHGKKWDHFSLDLRGREPILMCKMGAEKRGIDLRIASADAKYWWKTGLVPLRETPKA